jgi:RNA polymerase sigma-70 factor (ECF subfamily)
MPDQLLQETIEKSQRGDEPAFSRLVRGHQTYVFASALRLLCDEHDAEEIVQQTFIRVWQNLQRYDPAQKFTTWLYRIATNLCLDRLRVRSRDAARVSSLDQGDARFDVPDPGGMEERHSNQEIAAIVRRLISQLPEKQRLVFVLRDLQELSMEEVAAVTGMSVGSIKTNLCYARQRIREILRRQLQIEEA